MLPTQIAQRLEIVLLVASVAMVSADAQGGPVVTTKYGKIRGVYTQSVAVFYGVPFAKPPIGDLRWKKPEDAPKWGSDVYNATVAKPACPQYNCERLTPAVVCPKQTSEDCLYLDIYIPRGGAANATAGWPVMVYIHGGNFVHISGSSPLFDGRKLAGSKGVIQVNINYRMGALGFLVTGESSSDARGNYGVLDQQLALKWVMDNIKHFGGDTAKITLFGQSAGAQSTLIHLTLPSSAPYFRNAILESTPIAIPYKRFPEAILLGSLFTELVGCPPRDMNCLRSKTANEIAYAQFQAGNKLASLKLLEFFEPWGPFVDGEFIKDEPLPLIQSGQFSPKPLIIGTTSEETVLYIFSAWNTSVSDRLYAEVVLAMYPRHAIRILNMYPPSQPSDERNQMVKLGTDLIFACPTRNATRVMRSRGLTDVWLYVWDHALSFPGWGPITFCNGRVCHGSEIVYVFDSAWVFNFTFTPDEDVLSEQIMDFWTNFAKTGNPNDPGRDQRHARRGSGTSRSSGPKLAWPAYGEEGDWPLFRFKTPTSSVEANYHGPYCDFWDSVGYAA